MLNLLQEFGMIIIFAFMGAFVMRPSPGVDLSAFIQLKSSEFRSCVKLLPSFYMHS